MCCLVAGPVLAQWSGWDYENDREKKPWSEIEVPLPPYPKASNLIRFDPGGGSTHRFYIDAASLSIGKDGVVHYSLVIKTAGGATNVTFEGMRCRTREAKIYAVGSSGGTWTEVRDPRWREIDFRDVNPYHSSLYADYLCRGNAPVRSVEEVINRLKYPSSSSGGE